MQFVRCRNQAEFFALYESDAFVRRREFEQFLASSRREANEFRLPGFCVVDAAPVDFLIDKQHGQAHPDGYVVPNWRERLVCPQCQLNNRERAVIGYAREIVDALATDSSRPPQVYLMEQVTALFHAFGRLLPDAEIVGSEFLGLQYEGGELREGIRHENAEELSFPDECFDLVISTDVLEHVNDPVSSFREIVRVLKPGGHLLLSIPFDVHKQRNRTRATLAGDRIIHVLPPVFHGNPLSNEGSLVFTEFGWEALSQIEQSGLRNCGLNVYWSLEYGYLGGCQFFIHGTKGNGAAALAVTPVPTPIVANVGPHDEPAILSGPPVTSPGSSLQDPGRELTRAGVARPELEPALPGSPACGETGDLDQGAATLVKLERDVARRVALDQQRRADLAEAEVRWLKVTLAAVQEQMEQLLAELRALQHAPAAPMPDEPGRPLGSPRASEAYTGGHDSHA